MSTLWYKLRDFFLTYHVTATSLSALVIIDIIFAITIHQMTQFCWLNGSMLILILAWFCHEHATVSFDPDTAEYKHWNVAAELIFVGFLIGLCILGNSVIQLYQ